MIIKTTKNSSISSIHIGATKNPISLYNLIHTLIKEDIDIFAKPILENNNIKWETDVKNDFISYTNADEETKDLMRTLIKAKIDKIFSKINKEHTKLLESVFEIPNENDIYLIDGNRIVLTNWGHIENKLNPRRKIIFNLKGSSKAKLTIKVLFNQKEKENCNVVINHNNSEDTYITDKNGIVEVYLPLNSKIIIDVVCNKIENRKEIFLKRREELLTFSLKEKKKIKINWYKLLIFLIPIILLILYFLLIYPRTEFTISWNKKYGDFDLHIIDNCNQVTDSFNTKNKCKNKTIKFIKQTQGFDCSSETCKETILAPNGINDKIKIIINKYSSKEDNGVVTLTIKKGYFIKKFSKNYSFKKIHPMLNKLQPNKNDIIVQW